MSRAAANAPMTTRVNSSRHALKSRAPDSPLFNRRPPGFTSRALPTSPEKLRARLPHHPEA